MNLNELIKKYEENIIECDRVIKAYQLCEKTRNIHKGIKQASKDILSDLEKLKESLKNGERMERLADVEHKRWANWQSYLHSLCVKNEDGSLTIPKERVEWGNKEIETSYYHLEEKLKEYDRIEVRNTLKEIIGE